MAEIAAPFNLSMIPHQSRNNLKHITVSTFIMAIWGHIFAFLRRTPPPKNISKKKKVKYINEYCAENASG